MVYQGISQKIKKKLIVSLTGKTRILHFEWSRSVNVWSGEFTIVS